MTALNNYVSRLVPLFYTQDTIVVTITEPDDGDVVTSATPTFTWEFSPGTQQSYVLQIFSDPAGSNLVYSSGVVSSALLQHVPPAGTLDNAQTYYVSVGIFTTDGVSGQSELVEFSTSFAPSVDVENVTVRVFDLCADPQDSPYVEIRWAQVVPGGGEDFVEYRVLRREGGESTWTVLTQISAVGTLVFRDHLPRSYALYEYAVVWVALSGSNTLISVAQDPPPIAQAQFDYGWLQSASAPGATALRIDALSTELEVVQDLVMASTAGRQRPTAFVGEPLYHVVRIPPANKGTREESYWVDFLAFVESQAEGTVYCLRLGKQRLRYFGVLTIPRRTGGQASFGVGFIFNEVHYLEDVTL